MRFYRVFPDPRLMIDADSDEGRRALADLYPVPEGPYVRINMIVTPRGDTTGPDSTSGSLSSPADRHLVTLLRQHSEAVIIGAETLRRERIPLPSDTPLIVLTSSGTLSWGNLIHGPSDGRVVVMTDNPGIQTGSPDGLSIEFLTVAPGQLSPQRIIELCREKGWNRLLVEGGRHTATSFVTAQVVDELCLTLTGPPAVDTSPPVPWWPHMGAWEIQHLLTDDNRMLFHRFLKPETAVP